MDDGSDVERAREFSGSNALLYLRLGDYAVFDGEHDETSAKVSGLFDEEWKHWASSKGR
jgi:hypothetical protein